MTELCIHIIIHTSIRAFVFEISILIKREDFMAITKAGLEYKLDVIVSYLHFLPVNAYKPPNIVAG